MSGHSKWATIKHQKGAKDKARGKLFAKLIRQVEVAAREGGGDIEANPTLRTMYQKARDASVPHRHHRARHQAGHRRARGRHLRVDHLRGLRAGRRGRARSTCSPTTATAPAPRSAACSPSTAARWPSPARWRGSSTARAWCSCRGRSSEDDVMLAALEAGAEDIVDDGDTWRLTCDAARDLHAVRDALEAAGHRPSSRPTSTMVPSTTIALDRRRGGQEGAAPHRRARGPRRRAGRVRQLRHPRRHPRSRWRPEWPSPSATTAPDFTLPGTDDQDYRARRTTGASRSCWSSTRATTRRSAPSS